MAGNPTGGEMGLPKDSLGWQWKSEGGGFRWLLYLRVVPVQPDNLWRCCITCFGRRRATVPMIPLDENLRPTWLFGQTVHEGCYCAGDHEQADFTGQYGSPQVHRQTRMLGTGRAVQCRQARLDGWRRRLRGKSAAFASAARCPGFPDKFMPFMEEPPGAKLSTQAVATYGRVRGRCCFHEGLAQSGTIVCRSRRNYRRRTIPSSDANPRPHFLPERGMPRE